MEKLKLSLHLIVTLTLICGIGCQEMKESGVSVPSERSARQLSFWPYSNNLSRQIFDMLDIVTDVAMLTLLGIPILGLVALGASVIGPSVGAAAGRKKRSSDDHILDRAKRAILYARNLFDVLANLEDTFQKYEITESECQLKAVCEVHKSENTLNSEYQKFGSKITDLIRMQKDLEEYEIIPFAKIIFGQYADAATYGSENNDCDMVYSRCSHNLDDLLNKNKEKSTTEEEKH